MELKIHRFVFGSPLSTYEYTEAQRDYGACPSCSPQPSIPLSYLFCFHISVSVPVRQSHLQTPIPLEEEREELRGPGLKTLNEEPTPLGGHSALPGGGLAVPGLLGMCQRMPGPLEVPVFLF